MKGVVDSHLCGLLGVLGQRTFSLGLPCTVWMQFCCLPHHFLDVCIAFVCRITVRVTFATVTLVGKTARAVGLRIRILTTRATNIFFIIITTGYITFLLGVLGRFCRFATYPSGTTAIFAVFFPYVLHGWLVKYALSGPRIQRGLNNIQHHKIICQTIFLLFGRWSFWLAVWIIITIRLALCKMCSGNMN